MGRASIFADKRGYYRDAGFSSVTLLAGGPGAPPVEVMVMTGKALASISSLSVTASALLQGAPLKTIGVQYQTSPYIIASPAARPLRTPHDMIGKRIGVPGGNELTWTAFLRVNAIDPASIDVDHGRIDAGAARQQSSRRVAGLRHQRAAPLAAAGIRLHTFGLGEFGYPLVNNNYIVSDATLRTQREAVKALLRSEIRGWKASLASPALSAQVTVGEYGRDLGLTLADQIQQSTIQRTLMESAANAHARALLDDARANRTQPRTASRRRHHDRREPALRLFRPWTRSTPKILRCGERGRAVLLIDNVTAVTVDTTRRIVAEAAIAVEGERIAEVGKVRDLARALSGRRAHRRRRHGRDPGLDRYARSRGSVAAARPGRRAALDALSR